MDTPDVSYKSHGILGKPTNSDSTSSENEGNFEEVIDPDTYEEEYLNIDNMEQDPVNSIKP